MVEFLHRWFIKLWYGKGGIARTLLLPFAWCYRCYSIRRRNAYLTFRKPSWDMPVPVWIIGNLTVGGSGKTPLCATVARLLQQQGRKPGIVSRGYGGEVAQQGSDPLVVTKSTPAQIAGDEPVWLARQGLSVAVGADRVLACQHLLQERDCDVILCDDGLQHYRLRRTLEIAVVDSQLGLGNRLCLPAGPLREPPERLASVSCIAVNHGYAPTPSPPIKLALPDTVFCTNFRLKVDGLQRVAEQDSLEPPQQWHQRMVHAVAGIAHPQRFFDTLTALGMEVVPHSFIDHHHFSPSELDFGDSLPVVMTAKDAVKCDAFAQPNWWYLSVSANLDQDFAEWLTQQIPQPHPSP